MNVSDQMPVNAAPPEEKRALRRFTLQLPIVVRGENTNTLFGETQDVSSQGVRFIIDKEIEPGSIIDFILTLPPEMTMTESIRVRCQARVLRITDTDEAGKKAIAAQISRYEFVLPNE